LKNFDYLILELITHFSYLYNDNYTPNEVVDILLVLGECHRNYRNVSRLYAESRRYPDCRHPNPQQVINIKRKSRKNPLH